MAFQMHDVFTMTLLDTLRGLDHLGNCVVQLYLLSRVHIISSGMAVSKASVALSSHPNNTNHPMVTCSDNMSNPGESVNEMVNGFQFSVNLHRLNANR